MTSSSSNLVRRTTTPNRHALELADQRSIRYISPFNDTNVIAGQATVLTRCSFKHPELEHVVVPVGGGDSSRVSCCREKETVDATSRSRGLSQWRVRRCTTCCTEKDVRGRSPPHDRRRIGGWGDEGAITNELIAHHEVPLVLVEEIEIRRAVREAAEVNGLVFEGSAATP